MNEEDIERIADINGGPLQISIRDEDRFIAIIPGPVEMLPILGEWARAVLLDPPDEMPPGEVKVFKRRLQYTAQHVRIWPAKRGWFQSLMELNFAPRRPYWDFWPAEDAAAYLEQAWIEEWGDLIDLDEPLPTPALVPTPVAPPVEVKAGLRGLIQMAQEMGLTPEILEERLESRDWNYVVTKRVSTESEWRHQQTEGYKGIWRVRHEYFFDKSAAVWNVAHKDEAGRVRIKQGDRGD